MNRIVAKFGGTSMKDAAAILQSSKVALDNGASIVVVSATAGTTDQLIELANTAKSKPWRMCEEILEAMLARHNQIAKDLSAPSGVFEMQKKLVDEAYTLAKGISLLREVSPKTHDSLVSIGERMSSSLMTAAFTQLGDHADYLDARDIILTDDEFMNAKPEVEEIAKIARKKLIPRIKTGKRYITQGFIGRSPAGSTTTLGRGGSDYSAALFAEAIKADELQIWTDVSGIASTDPRIAPKAQSIDEISFQEAAEMANSGAKVLHAMSVLPARRQGIPVFVGNAGKPEEGGTWIREAAKKQPVVRVIALKPNQTMISIQTPEMAEQHGFLAKIFNVFAYQQVSVDQVSTSQVAVVATVEKPEHANKKLIAGLSELAEVNVEHGLSLVSIIGNRVHNTPGLVSKVFESLEQKSPKINIRMVCQGASEHDLCFLVPDNQGKEAVKRIHKAFVESS